MSEREAMTQRVVAYHNAQARGASFEWHARCATHAQNQEQIIKAVADALERHGWACRVTLGQPRPDCNCVGCQSAGALRLVGRLL